MLSHPEYLTREQQHHLARLQSLEHRPFRLVGVGSASLVEQAAANQIAAELYYCFAMTQIACQSLSQRPDDIEPLFRHYLRKACLRLNHPVPEIAGELLKGIMRRAWPSNVRELANAAELLLLACCRWRKRSTRSCFFRSRPRLTGALKSMSDKLLPKH